MKTYLILLLSLLTFNLYASDFSGHWAGDGKYISHSKSYLCSQYRISIMATQENLSIFNGSYTCKGKLIELSDYELIIHNNTLYQQNGKQVGTISDERITILGSDPSYEIFISRFEKNLFVIESTITSSREEFMIGILR